MVEDEAVTGVTRGDSRAFHKLWRRKVRPKAVAR